MIFNYENDYHFCLPVTNRLEPGVQVMRNSAVNRRKLWTMSCETLFQNLAASLAPELIAKLCRRHQYPLPGGNYSNVALYHLAHEHCHRDSPFSRQVQRYLTRRHAAVVSQTAQLTPSGVRAKVSEVLAQRGQPHPANLLPALMWAVCSDPRPELRPIEKLFIEELHLRSHGLLLAQFRGEILPASGSGSADTERETLERSLRETETERNDLRQAVQDLQRANTHMMRNNAELEGELDHVRQRHDMLENQRRQLAAQASQGVALRDVRKLRYEVARLSDALRKKETEAAHLAATVASYECQSLVTDDLARQENPDTPPECPVFDLQGKRVALIGGLTKASGHYEQTISELGGLCMRYEGSANQGHKKLARIIRQADVVFCPVDCVSHGTASAAKKLCRSLDKPCHFLRSSGVSHVREKPREVVAG